MSSDDTFIPPYGISWRTFLHALDKMAEHPLPPALDRTYLTWMPGGHQTQYLAATRSFGLVSGSEHTVTPLLTKLVTEPTSRPGIIEDLLRTHYAPVVELAGTNATYKALSDLWREQFGQDGETRRKAITFYKQAAHYAEVPVSPHWDTGTTRPSSPTKPKARKARKSTPKPTLVALTDHTGTEAIHRYHVRLASGGYIDVTASVDLFGASSEDRQYVSNLAEFLRSYPEWSAEDANPTDEQPDDEGLASSA